MTFLYLSSLFVSVINDKQSNKYYLIYFIFKKLAGTNFGTYKVEYKITLKVPK